MKASHNINKSILLSILFLPGMMSAETANAPAAASVFSNPLFNTLLMVIIVLAMMILGLSGALRNIIGSDYYVDKLKKEKNAQTNQAARSLTLLFFILLAFSGHAQELKEAKAQMESSIAGLDKTTFYTMAGIIAAELIVLGILFNTFKSVLGAQTSPALKAAPVKSKSFLDKINATVEIEKEESIMLDHEYDGIRELDNDLPPWWKYGFYLTILVAVSTLR